MIRRALTRLWRRREPRPRMYDREGNLTAYGRDLVYREWPARDHDQPDFDPRPDDVLAGRS